MVELVTEMRTVNQVSKEGSKCAIFEYVKFGGVKFPSRNVK